MFLSNTEGQYNGSWVIHNMKNYFFSLFSLYQIILKCYNLYHYGKSDIHKVANAQSEKKRE